MNILHISDFHFVKNSEALKRQSAFLETIHRTLQGKKIDVCVFCGDLVDKYSAKFEDAYDLINTHLLTPLKCNQFMITCGNHDVDRTLIQPMFSTYLLKEMSTISKLNDFVDKNIASQFSSNCKHIDSFLAFQKSLFPASSNDLINPLWSLHKRHIDNQNIAIATVNLAWSAVDDNESKKALLFPPTILHAILKEASDCDFKILLTHFPLECLHDVCRSEIQNIVYKDFQCIMSGHYHKEDFSIQYFSRGGILKCISPATLSVTDIEHAGFITNEINMNNMSSLIGEYHYDCKKDQAVLFKTYNINIPVTEEKKDSIKLRKALEQKHESILEDANRLFVHAANETKLSFLEIFSEPVLRTKNRSVSTTIKNDNLSTSKTVKYTDLLGKDNYIVYGDDKSGKTSLLYRILLHYLNEFDRLDCLPVLIDLKPYYRGLVTDFDVVAHLNRFYNLSRLFLDAILATKQVVLLLDNYSFAKPEANEPIIKAILKVPHFRVIFTASNSLKITTLNEFSQFAVNDLYIHDITRKQVRELTYKWPLVKQTTKEQVVDKLTSIFTDLNIHFNYWTVSLFLWIFEKTSVVNLHNNFELIELYIDNLLEKANLALNLKKTFSFDNLKDFLSELAFLLYSTHEQGEYACTYSSLVSAFNKFKSSNVRIVADPKELIDYIIEKNIVVQIQEDLYTFRLNGVFEYFLAYYMKRNAGFREKIVENSEIFLSFKNELEIYAGFTRNDEDLLVKIYYNCLTVAEEMLKMFKPDKNDFDEMEVNEGVKEYREFLLKLKDEVCPISHEEQDALNEEIHPLSNIDSRVKTKTKYNLQDINSIVFSEHLIILGRVLRNSDNILEEKMVSEIFDFLVDQSCLLIMYSFKEALNEMAKTGDTKMKELLRFMKSFTPIIAHAFLFDAVGHKNLANLIKNKIKECTQSKPINEFRLFVLVFLAVESDLLGEMDLLEELIDLASKWSTKNSILLKLLMFSAFKATDHPSLEKLLKEKAEKVFKKLYPDKDKSSIHETIRRISHNG